MVHIWDRIGKFLDRISILKGVLIVNSIKNFKFLYKSEVFTKLCNTINPQQPVRQTNPSIHITSPKHPSNLKMQYKKHEKCTERVSNPLPWFMQVLKTKEILDSMVAAMAL
jgi:hypothetical protein